MVEQPFFSPDSAGIPCKVARGPDHPVAGDHDGDAILAIGGADCADRFFILEGEGDVAVTALHAIRDAEQGIPDLLLEIGALGPERHVKGLARACEVFFELQLAGFEAFRHQFALARILLDKVHRRDAAFLAVDADEADRAVHGGELLPRLGVIDSCRFHVQKLGLFEWIGRHSASLLPHHVDDLPRQKLQITTVILASTVHLALSCIFSNEQDLYCLASHQFGI